ncbi:hypothetical protein [Mucilaginibacter pedocola]|uniref:Uncharacterized protein n=1 Tax=Mucilaginibacter pedocola TaxID=1792845 RepID=A0A1S9PKQ7_9SPHI|nr:hypothetical protein [Mucilaginibacter pedocola]OOQ61525.1 hypothetical protein BC343_00140 [Mucilaginibacter pedocola]
MNQEKIYFQDRFCNDKECLPLTEAIKRTLSPEDQYQPECVVIKFKKWGEYGIKAYYRVNNQLFYATAKMDLSGKILSKKLNAKNGKGSLLKLAV